nr:AbrB/MazE/SpoVT family DNA-binding domain-containing protein [Candidatus Njordarchaeota archaeon]
MSLKRRLGQKGQIVIPKVARESLGIEPGDEVLMEISRQGVLIKPKMNPEEFVRGFCSVVSKKVSKKVDLERIIGEEAEERLALH